LPTRLRHFGRRGDHPSASGASGKRDASVVNRRIAAVAAQHPILYSIRVPVDAGDGAEDVDVVAVRVNSLNHPNVADCKLTPEFTRESCEKSDGERGRSNLGRVYTIGKRPCGWEIEAGLQGTPAGGRSRACARTPLARPFRPLLPRHRVSMYEPC